MAELSILGQSLQIPDFREAYNDYRLLFRQKADHAVVVFNNLYHRYNASLDDVVRNVPAQAAQSIRPVLEFCVDTLIKHGILDIDIAGFEDQYGVYNDIWAEPFLKISDQYAEIVLDQKQLDEYRTIRRQYRSRWRGGGFSLAGALRGAATAGVLNVITGAGHMLFNGVGKIVSSISASRQKNTIFNSPETYESIAEGVGEAAFALHLALIDCLAARGANPIPLAGAVSPEDARSALSILNNAHLIDDIEQRRCALVQSFRLDPYQEDWYRYALQMFGDADGSLSEAEQHFGISVIASAKAEQLDAFAQTLPLNTETEALEATRRLQREKERLHYAGETPQTQAALDAVERFDEQYRTVDGILLSTRQGADEARQELQLIQSIEEQLDEEDLSSLSDAIGQMNCLSSPVATRHRQNLQQKWDDLDIRLRTLDTLLPDGKAILCESQQQVREWMSIARDLSQRLADCGEGPSAETALHSLKAQLMHETLPSELRDSYYTEIAKRLSIIDLQLRTTLGKEYPTREAARAAEQVYEQIRADFSTGNPRKNGARFRERIEAADFSNETKAVLLDDLFQLENARELKTAKAFSAVTTIILLAIVIGSYFFQLSGTTDFARKDIMVKGVSLMVTDVQIVEGFTFADGLKNGLVVFGRCLGDVFVNGFWEYIHGFQNGVVGNIIWAVLGLFWVILKHFLIFIPRYLVSLAVTLFQRVHFTYHIGYIIGSAIPLAVSQFSFDDEGKEENVKRIKGWTRKKVILTILAVLILGAFTLFCLKNHL